MEQGDEFGGACRDPQQLGLFAGLQEHYAWRLTAFMCQVGPTRLCLLLRRQPLTSWFVTIQRTQSEASRTEARSVGTRHPCRVRVWKAA